MDTFVTNISSGALSMRHPIWMESPLVDIWNGNKEEENKESKEHIYGISYRCVIEFMYMRYHWFPHEAQC